jgi:anti-sigma B factor antagonist
METLLEKTGDVRILHLRGRLDLTAAADFNTLLDRIVSEGGKKVVMQCRDLQYVSSSGLGAFITAGKKLGSSKVVFAELNQHVQNLFEMAGITQFFQICGTKEDALRHLENVS